MARGKQNFERSLSLFRVFFWMGWPTSNTLNWTWHFFFFFFFFWTLPIQLGTSPLSLRLRPISCPLLLTLLPSLSLPLPGSRGLVFAHASLAVHLEQLLSSLLRLQIDRERAAWARLAFCLLPECVGLDGSQPENALPVRVSSVRACRTTTEVLSRQVQWYRNCWAHSCFHRLLYQINVHWSGQFNIPGGWLGTSWSSFCHWDGRRENCFQGNKKERNGRSGVHTTDAAIRHMTDAVGCLSCLGCWHNTRPI